LWNQSEPEKELHVFTVLEENSVGPTEGQSVDDFYESVQGPPSFKGLSQTRDIRDLAKSDQIITKPAVEIALDRK
jgi:hypothetical protein